MGENYDHESAEKPDGYTDDHHFESPSPLQINYLVAPSWNHIEFLLFLHFPLHSVPCNLLLVINQLGAAVIIISDEAYCSSDYSWILVEDCRLALAQISNAFYEHPSEVKLVNTAISKSQQVTRCNSNA